MGRTGIRPPSPEALKAKCCECCASYGDGRYVDCEIRVCPLYHRMPYRNLTPDYSWVFDKWTQSYRHQQLALGLTEQQFIEHHIIRPDGKINIGFTKLFRAKCYRCCGNFFDGRVDCKMVNCSLYYWMPYRKHEPTLDWMFDLPYTRKHNDKMIIENLTRSEYINKYILKSNSVSEDDEESESTPPPRKVRRLL